MDNDHPLREMVKTSIANKFRTIVGRDKPEREVTFPDISDLVVPKLKDVDAKLIEDGKTCPLCDGFTAHKDDCALKGREHIYRTDKIGEVDWPETLKLHGITGDEEKEDDHGKSV